MNYFKIALQRHKGAVVAHPINTGILLVLCGIILVSSHIAGTLLHAFGYLSALWLCALVTDVVVAIRPTQPAFTLRQPVKKELLVIAACTLLGVIFFCIRFFSDWEHLHGIVRLAAITLIIFAFPIALALIFLFRFKYTFKELGVNLNYWYLPLFLHLIIGGTTMIVAPEKSHWSEAAEEYGIWDFIATGIIGAALSEEFSRMLVQTRVGFAARNLCAGIFAASFVWSAMHLPVSYNQNPSNFDAWEAIGGIIYLMPLGIFWGYLTYRTQSLLPVILMHGFNLWGLQNF